MPRPTRPKRPSRGAPGRRPGPARLPPGRTTPRPARFDEEALKSRGARRATKAPACDVYVCNPGLLDVLQLELDTHARGRARHAAELAPGVLAVPAGPLVDAVYARQVLPRARMVQTGDLDAMAQGIFDALGDAADDVVTGDARIDMMAYELFRQGSKAIDAHPLDGVRERLEEKLWQKTFGRAKKRGITRKNVPVRAATVLLTSGDTAYVARPHAVTDPLRAWPSAFSGGSVVVDPDFDAPSSAHRKLDEAIVWLGCTPGPEDHMLDLGSAPGGWTWVGRRTGARVTAVDRADMDGRVLADPGVTHLRQSAFDMQDPADTTWLVCDVIDVPERAAQVLERGLAMRALKAAVVTAKMRRPVDPATFARIAAVCEAAEARGFVTRAKNLFANKLEFTVMWRKA